MRGKGLISRKWQGIVAAVLALVLLVSSSLPVKVAAATAEFGTPVRAMPDGERWEPLYDRLMLAADNQGNRIEYAQAIIEDAGEWINNLKEGGQDVSALEEALATFRGKIANAEESHGLAVEVLSAHAGFDETGHVIATAEARRTILKAASDLRQTHLVFTQATLDFRLALRTWRQAHKG